MKTRYLVVLGFFLLAILGYIILGNYLSQTIENTKAESNVIVFFYAITLIPFALIQYYLAVCVSSVIGYIFSRIFIKNQEVVKGFKIISIGLILLTLVLVLLSYLELL